MGGRCKLRDSPLFNMTHNGGNLVKVSCHKHSSENDGIDLLSTQQDASECRGKVVGHVFFADHGVSVTSADLVLPNRAVLSVSEIYSARVIWSSPERRSCALLLFVCLAIFIFSKQLDVRLASAVAIVACFAWGGSMKSTYQVELTTSTGKSRVLESPDKQWISNVVDAVNRAVRCRE